MMTTPIYGNRGAYALQGTSTHNFELRETSIENPHEDPPILRTLALALVMFLLRMPTYAAPSEQYGYRPRSRPRGSI